jgi:hypothetical protein
MSQSADNTAHLTIYDDATDDYLSVSSKKSFEDERIHSAIFGTPQSTSDESTNSEKEKPNDAVIDNPPQNIVNEPMDNERKELVDSVIMETLQDMIDKLGDNKNKQSFFDLIHISVNQENELDLLMEHQEERSIISASSDSDKQMVMVPSDPEIIDLPQEIEISPSYQQIEDQSIIGTFYIPDDTEISANHSNTLQQQDLQNENDQVFIISDTSSDPGSHNEIEMPVGEAYRYM